MKKSIFLILTLAIPVSIFLFLKFFGSNTFDVPVLFENGIPDCDNSGTIHLVPDFGYTSETEQQLSSSNLEGFLIFGVLNVEDWENSKKKLIELVRIQDAFYESGSPKFVLFSHGDLTNKSDLVKLCLEIGMEPKSIEIAVMPTASLSRFLKCGIALTNENTQHYDNLVLVDSDRNIRGIYHAFDLEETDQLILEFKILKKMM